MKNKILILLSVMVLAACGTTKPIIAPEVQKVEVPIAVACKEKEPEKPTFGFNDLTPESDIYQKSQILLSDRKLHLAYETELLAALKSCLNGTTPK